MVLLVLEVSGRISILVKYLLYALRSKISLRVKGNIRPVNINTIKWLIFNGVKYIVE
jgi:hypothetical protein